LNFLDFPAGVQSLEKTIWRPLRGWVLFLLSDPGEALSETETGWGRGGGTDDNYKYMGDATESLRLLFNGERIVAIPREII